MAKTQELYHLLRVDIAKFVTKSHTQNTPKKQSPSVYDGVYVFEFCSSDVRFRLLLILNKNWFVHVRSS